MIRFTTLRIRTIESKEKVTCRSLKENTLDSDDNIALSGAQKGNTHHSTEYIDLSAAKTKIHSTQLIILL